MAIPIEKWASRNKALLKLFAVTFALWNGFDLFSSIVQNLFRYTGRPLFAPRLMIYPPQTAEGVLYLVLGLVVLVLLIVIAITWVALRLRLRREPEIRSALKDERVRMNWLRAFRFAFLCTAAVYVIQQLFWNGIQIVHQLTDFSRAVPPAWLFAGSVLPESYTYVAVLSLLISFLIYDRELVHAAMDA